MKQQAPLTFDCFDPRSGLVPIEQAEQLVLENVQQLSATEVVALPNALNRVLVHSIRSNIDVPPHANSAMDGFAVAAASLPASGSKEFEVAGYALAGKPWISPCLPHQVVGVTTGAVMPEGTDTVVIQEEVSVHGDLAVIGAPQKEFQNVRAAGEDLKKGSTAVAAGTRLGPAELGVLASTGLGKVKVSRQPQAAVFSTGDELLNAGEPLIPGAIYDSNRYVISAMLERAGTKVQNLGVIPDDPEKTLSALQHAGEQSDLIVTSGGVSTGSADYIIKVLQELGEVHLWRIGIRPGRPFAFGKIGAALFFGLPGNPVAVMVTFYRLVRPALRKLMGEADIHPVPVTRARAITKFRKKPNRAEVYRAVFSTDDAGEPVVAITGYQGSGLLSSMSQANCFVLLDDDDVTAEPGDMVNVQFFDGIF